MTNPTCLTALKENLDEVEQAFSSVQLQLDTARYNLKVKDAQNGELFAKLKDSEAEEQRLRALLKINAKRVDSMLTPEQAADQINKVHDELMEKLVAERKDLEAALLNLQQVTNERESARKAYQTLHRENNELRKLTRAQGGRIDTLVNELARAHEYGQVRNVKANRIYDANQNLHRENQALKERIAELQSVGPALDILSTMVKELEARLEESEARRMATTETESVCHEHGHHGGKNCPMCFPPVRVTAEELFVKFKPVVYDLLKCIYNMTTPAVSALQYGSHHGHRALHAHIVRYRRFIENKNNIDEALRV